MSQVNVVVALGLEERLIEQVRAVDSRLDVTRLTAAQLRVYRAGRHVWYERHEPKEAETETEEEAKQNFQAIMAKANVLFSTPSVPTDLADLSPHLRWIQSTAAGADRILDNPIANDVVITTASGIHAIPIGEYVIGAILAFSKGFPSAIHSQEGRAWQGHGAEELKGRTVGIIGLGAIGSQVAKLARFFGLRILASRRSVSERKSGPDAGLEDIDELLPPSDLHYLLGESDYVVITAPITPETHHLIGTPELKSLKPSAVIINISRGAIIDEPALIEALREGRIRGAALDVFEKEPLPPESELWDLPNVILTPHSSGSTTLYMDRAIELFCDNLRRFLAGPGSGGLRNILDPTRGY